MTDLRDALGGILRGPNARRLGSAIDWMGHGLDVSPLGRGTEHAPGLVAMFDPRTKEGLFNIAASAAGGVAGRATGVGAAAGASEEEALTGQQLRQPGEIPKEFGSHALRGGAHHVSADAERGHGTSLGSFLAAPFVDTARWTKEGALAAAHGAARAGRFFEGLSHRSNIDWQIQYIAKAMREKGVPNRDAWRIASQVSFAHDIAHGSERDKGIRLGMAAWKKENRAKQQRPGAR